MQWLGRPPSFNRPPDSFVDLEEYQSRQSQDKSRGDEKYFWQRNLRQSSAKLRVLHRNIVCELLRSVSVRGDQIGWHEYQ